MSKKTAVMLSTFLFSIAITLIDAFVHPNYFVKIPIKILFFLALPMLFFLLNELHDNVSPSWFVHMFASFAINTVGFILFGIL